MAAVHLFTCLFEFLIDDMLLALDLRYRMSCGVPLCIAVRVTSGVVDLQSSPNALCHGNPIFMVMIRFD